MGMAKLNVFVSGMDDPCGVDSRTWYVTITLSKQNRAPTHRAPWMGHPAGASGSDSCRRPFLAPASA